MDCRLADVLDALSGGPAPDVRMVAPPPWVGPAAAPPFPGPPGADGIGASRPIKGVYGERLPYGIDGRNFTVQWSDPSVDPARAADVLAHLEGAWDTLVVAEGWPAPVSSGEWLLWVILDPELGGSGYTTVYPSDDYPLGYPVTYLNPAYDEEDPAFGLSVAVHEFAHMLQYRVRDTSLGRADAWYWEATAEWVAERAAPELDTYAESTWWYAQWPHAPFDAFERFHPYGMLLLNAWLDEHAVGFDGIRLIWRGGGGVAWDARIAEVTGEDFGATVADMAAAVVAGGLRESALYEPPLRAAAHHTAPTWETLELPGLYGSHYIDVDDGPIVVSGPVLARFVQDGEVLDAAPLTGPYTAVFTGVAEEGALAYGTTPPEDRAAVPVGCGCAGASAPVGLAAVGLAAVLRRRRPSRPAISPRAP